MRTSLNPAPRLADSQRAEIMRILRKTPIRDLRQDIRSGDVLPSDVPPDLRRTGQKVRSLIRDRAAGRAFVRRLISMGNAATAYSPRTPEREAGRRKISSFLQDSLPKMSIGALRSAMRSTVRSAGWNPAARLGSGQYRYIDRSSASALREALTRTYETLY